MLCLRREHIEQRCCGDRKVCSSHDCSATLNPTSKQGKKRSTPSPPHVPGFKLDTLLRLADVKGTDKKTSLLAFVTRALLQRGASDVGALPSQLASVRPAANLQVRKP